MNWTTTLTEPCERKWICARVVRSIAGRRTSSRASLTDTASRSTRTTLSMRVALTRVNFTEWVGASHPKARSTKAISSSTKWMERVSSSGPTAVRTASIVVESDKCEIWNFNKQHFLSNYLFNYTSISRALIIINLLLICYY